MRKVDLGRLEEAGVDILRGEGDGRGVRRFCFKGVSVREETAEKRKSVVVRHDEGKIEMAGTFRWPLDHKFGVLEDVEAWEMPKQHGWVSFLRSWTNGANVRMNPDARSDVAIGGTLREIHPSVVDAFSFPTSLGWMLWRLKWRPVARSCTILVCGGSWHGEQRILTKTNYFARILGKFLKGVEETIRIVVVGPEANGIALERGMRVPEDIEWEEIGVRVKTCGFCGTLDTFLEVFEGTELIESRNTCAVMFNPGFGNTNRDLRASWMPSLVSLVKSNFLVVSTAANDHGDLRGEIPILSNLLGANFVTEPIRNPYSAASTLVAEETTGEAAKGAEWSCANSFTYAFQGQTKAGFRVDPSLLPDMVRKLNFHT